VIETAKLSMLDTLGVGLFGSRTESSRIVAEFVRESASVAESSVWGQGWKSSAPYAALVNGTSAHGIEMDDRSSLFYIHCGAAVVPAVMALWEKTAVSGKNVIEAIVAGYEIAYRIADALQGSFKRFYGSPIKSLFGATAAAGRMLGQDNSAMLNALGISGSMASGLREWSSDPEGTMVKRFMGGGWPAQNGVMAALLALRGLTGPATILEGDRGICRAFGIEKEPQIEKLTENLGEYYMIMQRCIKPYATCGMLQASVDCVNGMKSEYQITAEQIEQIQVGCSIQSYDMHDSKQPQSIMAAQYSMPFTTALAFLSDLSDPSVWDNGVLSRPEVLALVQKVDMFIDEELDTIFQETNDYGGTKMTVRLKDGRKHDTWVRYAKGTIENPATPEDIHRKFRVLAGHVFSEEKLDETARFIDRLEEQKRPDRLVELLT
jgi:2-methylcitrate dehydratase PrpD